MHRIPARSPAWVRLVAACAAALVLWLSWMAVDSHAHAELHGDASHGDHRCAITEFSHGATTVLAALVVNLIGWIHLGAVVARVMRRQARANAHAQPFAHAPPAGA